MPSSVHHLFALPAALIAALLVACTSGRGPATTPGDPIYTPDVRKLVVEDRGGGFAPGPPPGAACNPQLATYTLTVAAHRLDWQYCEQTGSGPDATYAPRSGSRVLTAAEWDALQPTLAALIVSDAMSCGADKPRLAVTVTTGDGDLEYGDDFYACLDRTRPYVVSDALDRALGALGQLARA
jgi:hypothetical protein